MHEDITLPPPEHIRIHVLDALERYWISDASLVANLPIHQNSECPAINGPLELVEIRLPNWAEKIGVDGCLLVPREAVTDGATWLHMDWWLASFLLLEAWHERVWEKENGPIHSYSFRLSEWDSRAWKYAWVNRIGLFLREWALQRAGKQKCGDDLLGPLPAGRIHMTHDVDAVAKTLPIRLKQSSFYLYNAVLSLSHKNFRVSAEKVSKAFSFFIGRDDWWTFDELLELEAKAGVSATFHFHSDDRPTTLKRWLFDPAYNVYSKKLKSLFRQLAKNGHRVGLHPGFDAWAHESAIAEQKVSLEGAAGVVVDHCRQHWLRFSWSKTWPAQQSAGLTLDSTLMFNDRPAFRSSAALAWHPWNETAGIPLNLNAIPSVIMDSHMYDYKELEASERKSLLRHWIEECMAVHGEIAVLWHPHTLTKDYGWKSGFLDLLQIIEEQKNTAEE